MESQKLPSEADLDAVADEERVRIITGLASEHIVYFVTGFQVWNDSPRSGAYISNLDAPTEA